MRRRPSRPLFLPKARPWLPVRLLCLVLIAVALTALPINGLFLTSVAVAKDNGNGNGGNGGGNGKGNNGNGNGNGGSNGNGNNGNGNGNGNNGNGNGNGGGNGNGNNGNGNGNGGSNGNSNNGNGNTSGNSSTSTSDTSNSTGTATSNSGSGSTSTAAAARPASAIAGVPGNTGTTRVGDRALAGEVIASNATPGFISAAQQLGFSVLETRPMQGLGFTIARLEVPKDMPVQSGIKSLKAAFPDTAIDADHIYQPQGSFSIAAPQFAQVAIHWPSVPVNCPVSSKIGIIDARVDQHIASLDKAMIVTSDFSDQLSSPIADTDHGTAIATLLVGQGQNSLLPQTPLFAANIFREDQAGQPVATAIGFVEALDWMVKQGVKIINVSVSGPGNDLMAEAVRRANEQGVQIVAAVGNDHLEDVKRYPAAYDGVIGVTAIDDHRSVLPEANKGNFVSFAAPGVNIWIPAHGTKAAGGYYSGTSFAAPFVTATLALFKGDVSRMRDAATDLGAPGFDPVYGWGLVQAASACTTAIGQKPAE